MSGKGENLRGGARLIEFRVKEAVFVPAEAVDLARDAILLRVALGGRDAVVKLDVASYVSGLDAQSLWDALIDTDSPLPRHMSQEYPRPQDG